MIIGVAGRKQAGKGTTANILHGIVLKEQGLILDYTLGPQGQLVVQTTYAADGGEMWGEWDITRKDAPFVEYSSRSMWAYVKIYSFADSLKSICGTLFNIPFKNLYGTDEDKNQKVPHLKWQNMPDSVGKRNKRRGAMTSREFLQYFGTNIMRKIWSPVWVKDTMDRIEQEDSELAVIADVRFPNEVDGILERGGKVIKLNRDVFGDSHESEVVLDEGNFDQDKFDYIVENGGKYTIDQLNEEINVIYKQMKE